MDLFPVIFSNDVNKARGYKTKAMAKALVFKIKAKIKS